MENWLAQVMTSNPQTVHPDKLIGHALHVMNESRFRHVPIVEIGNLIGIVSARDALGPKMEEFESELQRREQMKEIRLKPKVRVTRFDQRSTPMNAPEKALQESIWLRQPNCASPSN
jgi:signal-transduction protein with cAMP-binding, CBS, and nucleotidyltransferase domain